MNKEIINEARLFSERLNTEPVLRKAFQASSVSDDDAQIRIKEYTKVFSNYYDLKQISKSFSSYQDNVLLANQYIDATLTAVVRSFAGLCTIERFLDNPVGMFYYMDLIGATDGRKVLPNLGAEDLSGADHKSTWSRLLDSGNSYSTLLSKRIIPKSLKGTVTTSTGVVEITDDGKGNLVAPAGFLTRGTINYATGDIDLEFATAPAATDKLYVSAYQDQTGVEDINRFKTDLQHIVMPTFPQLLVGEANLVSLAAMQKSIGVDPSEFITGKLTELFTKLINKDIVSQIDRGYQGDSFEIDLKNTNFNDYRSRLDKLIGDLSEVESLLAEKSVKGVTITTIIAGKDAVTEFKKTKATGNFVAAPSSYINDLVGYLDGVPVLRHDSLPADTGYAIHKPVDGQLAPVGRGVFLPLTNTPTVGNYKNPTQFATGTYYQHATKLIAPELVQKFTIKTK